MTVREVVMLAAEELRIATETTEYFNGSSTKGQAKAEMLMTCYNLVENELALDYFTLTQEESVTSTGKVLFSALKCSPVRILEVTDAQGNRLEYALYPSYITVRKGAVHIRYVYTPNKKTIDDECDFIGKVSARLMAFGIAAEYCMAMGAFEEASLWDKKYKDAIEEIREPKGGRIALRRWA